MQIKFLLALCLMLSCIGCVRQAPDCESYCNNSGPYSCTTSPTTNPTICDGTNWSSCG